MSNSDQPLDHSFTPTLLAGIWIRHGQQDHDRRLRDGVGGRRRGL